MALRQGINSLDYFNANFMSLVTIRFETIDSKIVCAVDVRKSDEIVLMKGKDKKLELELYIRAGNTSKPLIDTPEIVEFCLKRSKPSGESY